MDGVGIYHSMEHYLTSLIDRKEYAEAVKYFEAHSNELERSGDSRAGAVLHLAAKAYASLTQLSTALKVARTAQHLVSAEGDSLELAEIFMTIGGILYDMSESKEAEKSFRDAESIFRRNDCLEGQSRALNKLAGLFFRQTDYKNSLAALMDAIEIARKLDDKQKMAFMMGNIGRIYTFTGNFAEAEKNLKFNIELSSELNDALEAARAYLSLGYIYMHQADYVQAEQALNDAYPLIVQAESKRDEVIYFTYLGELRYRSGHIDQSRSDLEQALSLSQEVAPGSTLEARVLRHLAELSLITREYRAAERYAAKAWVAIDKASNKVELVALCRIKAKLAEIKDRRSDAIRLYARSIELAGEAGGHIEKAETLMAAGRSSVFNLRQRVTYLFRAEEIYARSGLQAKQREVEKLIDETDQMQPVGRGIESPGSVVCPDDADYRTQCREIAQFKSQLPLIAASDLPVLLTGETGVGKDHLARYFHHIARPQGPFVAINCASLPETLLESELFGYSRGAFTGAEQNKQGLFLAANGGVLFLDEIGDMPLTLQTKLLGVLERRKVIPLGSTKPVDLDIKLIAATNRNLEQMVEEGSFRRDLYYRLSGVSFEIPPLRKRKEDIPLLLDLFMERCGLGSGENIVPPELVHQFVEHDWPGNTRELFNKVKRLEVMAQMVAEGDLVELARTMFDTEMPSMNSSLFDRVEQFERKIISEALLAARGNKSEAARMLGIHEATVRTKLKRYGIEAERYS